MTWIETLPDDFFIALLNEQLEWQDLARLDSAICVRTIRPTFLLRLSSSVQPNKARDIYLHWNRKESIFVDEYLNWVNLRGVPAMSLLNLSHWCHELSKPYSDRNWGTFPHILSIEGTSDTEEMFDFTHSLWKHCPNLQKAFFGAYCSVEASRTGDNIVPTPYRDSKDKNVTLLPLFRACKKLRDLHCSVLTFSAEEAQEVPRTLQSIVLEGSAVAQHELGTQHVRNMIKMINNLDCIKQIVFNVDGFRAPPELYVALCNSCPTMSEFQIYRGEGTIGIDVMLRQCRNLTSVSLRSVHDMSQEVFTMLFELPLLTYLNVGGSTTIPGLLPTYTSTTNITQLSIIHFELLTENFYEMKRILLACPQLKKGCMLQTISIQFMLENKELCKCLDDYKYFVDKSAWV